MAGSSSSSSSIGSCDCGIKLTKYVSIYKVSGVVTAWRMRIEVTDYNNIDPNIFMYERKSGVAPNDPHYDVFIGVASPVDIEEYPVAAPRPEGEPFFRLAEVDLVSRNQELLDETWYFIKQDVDELIRAQTHLCELTPEETFISGIL